MLNKTALSALAFFAFAGCSSIEALPLSGAADKAAPPAPTGNAWFDAGQNAVYARKKQGARAGQAKNMILFVGDGMDINTITAARIFDGQERGVDGEANALFFETFPDVAFSKTYTTDYMVADSAGTASAMNTGVKTRSGVLSITAEAKRGDCADALAHAAMTLAERAEDAGLSTGVVTTTELTHATPGAVYSHSGDRNWADDADMPEEARAAGCKDIARQLIEFDHGDGVDIALGGGRAKFTPTTVSDPEYPERRGERLDGRNLSEEWAAKSPDHEYVWNKADFDAAGAEKHLLGLFEPGHLQYEADRAEDGAGEPSLAEMTAKAVSHLSRNDKGFYLMVEAGKIDHAHHMGNAYRALKDTQALSEAVKTAREMTSAEDTLIIVTADHGHTLSIQGYPAHDADIMGLVTVPEDDGALSPMLAAGDEKPYTILGYSNGPGTVFSDSVDLSDGRPAPTQQEATDRNYRQQALTPTGGETHGGQDVPVYASGPNSDLVSGVIEQNVIYHIMADALGL